MHFPKDVSLIGIRWYVAYPLSYRHVEELLEERGIVRDQALTLAYIHLLSQYKSFVW